MVILMDCRGATAATYSIRVGEHDITGELERNAWTYELELVIKHPLYNSDTTENDICLLKTKMVKKARLKHPQVNMTRVNSFGSFKFVPQHSVTIGLMAGSLWNEKKWLS